MFINYINLFMKANRICLNRSHKNYYVTHVCTIQKCDKTSRWLCSQCILNKDHNHSQKNDCHIKDQQQIIEQFGKFHYYESINYNKLRAQAIHKCQIIYSCFEDLTNKLLLLFQELKVIQEQIKKNYYMKELNDIQEKLKQDFISLDNDDIEEILLKSSQYVKNQFSFNNIISIIDSIRKENMMFQSTTEMKYEKQIQSLDQELKCLQKETSGPNPQLLIYYVMFDDADFRFTQAEINQKIKELKIEQQKEFKFRELLQ
ncbi:hypothetical protein pb186bvf_007913 [Paramecium bursaria]